MTKKEDFYLMDEFFEKRSLYRLVEEAAQELPEKQKTVLRWRFFEGMTLKEIGKKLNNTQGENARRIEAKALRTLRRKLEEKLKTKEERQKGTESDYLESKYLYYGKKPIPPEIQQQRDKEWHRKFNNEYESLWNEHVRAITVSLQHRLRRTIKNPYNVTFH